MNLSFGQIRTSQNSSENTAKDTNVIGTVLAKVRSLRKNFSKSLLTGIVIFDRI